MPASIEFDSVIGGLSIRYDTGTSQHSWTDVSFPSGRYLFAAFVARGSAVASCTIAHPGFGSVQQRADATATNAGTGWVRRIVLFEVQHAGGSGTLSLTLASGDSWVAHVRAWRLIDIGNFIDAASAGSASNADNVNSITCNVNTTPTAGAGIVVASATTTTSNSPLTLSNWTTAAYTQSPGYHSFAGGGFVGTQPAAPVASLPSNVWQRPGLVVAARFAASAAPPPPAGSNAAMFPVL